MADTGNSKSTTADPSMDDAMAKMFEKSMKQLETANNNANKNGGGAEKTVKIFGFFEVPEMFGAIAEGLWNDASHEIAHWLQRNSLPKFTAAGKALGLEGTALTQSAAGATIALSVLVKSAMYINPVVAAYKKQHETYRELAQKSAPLLEEAKGSHGLGTLMGLKETDNEMLYYARKRVALETKNDIVNQWTNLFINVVPNVLMDYSKHKSVWNGEPIPAKLEGTDAGLNSWGRRIFNYGSPAIGKAIVGSNDRSLNRKIASPYSALKMVYELDAQVASNPKASTFQLPGKHSNALSLEKYIEKIIVLHQQNMAEISDDHVEIREALQDDVVAAAKPLAEAIRTGEMSALGLVNLLGTGKIIRYRGRAIATPEEIQTLVERGMPQQTSLAHVEPKEYYKDSLFTREEFKQALHALSGEEKMIFASPFPNSVLEDAGVSKGEIKKIDEYRKDLDRMVTDGLIGLNEKSEDELKEIGLSKREIETLHTAFKKIEQGGVEAVHALRSSPTNSRGIERLLLNAAVPQIVKGDTQYLGKLIETGHAKFDEVTSKDKKEEKSEAKAFDDERGEEGEKRSHVDALGGRHRETMRGNIDLSNRPNPHHAQRELERKDGVSHHVNHADR